MRTTTATLASTALVLAAAAGPAGSSPVHAAGGASTGASPVDAHATRATEAGLERKVIVLTNRKRAAAGCNPVRLRKPIRLAARRHSDRMADVGYPDGMEHQLPGEPDLGRRLTNAGYGGWTRIAENIAWGYPTARAVMRGWMRSPGHRRNILDCRLRHIGVGVTFGDDGTWWTQDFGRK